MASFMLHWHLERWSKLLEIKWKNLCNLEIQLLVKFYYFQKFKFNTCVNILDGLLNEHIRGRPLGMNFDTIGNNLIVADAYYGIFEVDLETGAEKQLVAADEVIGGIVSL